MSARLLGTRAREYRPTSRYRETEHSWYVDGGWVYETDFYGERITGPWSDRITCAYLDFLDLVAIYAGLELAEDRP